MKKNSSYHLTDFEKGQIQTFSQEMSLSNREISRRLKRSIDTINREVKKMKYDNESNNIIEKRGRKPILTDKEKRIIRRHVSINPFDNSKKIKKYLNLNVSIKTIQRYLNEMNLAKFTYKDTVFFKSIFS